MNLLANMSDKTEEVIFQIKLADLKEQNGKFEITSVNYCNKLQSKYMAFEEIKRTWRIFKIRQKHIEVTLLTINCGLLN
jgi:hypothetical protein